MTEYISVIPASPGYYPIYDSEDGEDPFVVYDPIIAWSVDKNDLHVFPVTPDGACSRNTETLNVVYDPIITWAVDKNDLHVSVGACSRNIIGTLNPDKTVTIFGKKTFKSFNDYINFRKK